MTGPGRSAPKRLEPNLSSIHPSKKTTFINPKSSSPCKKQRLVDDEIDSILESHQTTCPVPMTKISTGQYMFGSRKIYLRMKNNNLFVHVGGDLLNINEFLRTHVDSELNRMASEHDSQILNLRSKKKDMISQFKSNRSARVAELSFTTTSYKKVSSFVH